MPYGMAGGECMRVTKNGIKLKMTQKIVFGNLNGYLYYIISDRLETSLNRFYGQRDENGAC